MTMLAALRSAQVKEPIGRKSKRGAARPVHSSKLNATWQSLATRPIALQPKAAATDERAFIEPRFGFAVGRVHIDGSSAFRQRKSASRDDKRVHAGIGPGASEGDTMPAAAASLFKPGGGRPLDPTTRSYLRMKFPRLVWGDGGFDLDHVRVHTHGDAERASEAVGARAVTIGPNIWFNRGEYAPGTTHGNRLLAHELTHVAQQARGGSSSGPAGELDISSPSDPDEREATELERVVDDSSVVSDSMKDHSAFRPAAHSRSVRAGTLQLKPKSGPRTSYPWIGEVSGIWSAALRKTPSKDPNDLHANTIADLPQGTELMVTSSKSGWLAVEATVGGKKLNGYVSQELVRFVKASAFALPPVTVSVHIPTIAEAIVMLKRAETRKRADPSWTPSMDEQDDFEFAAGILEKTGKYSVLKSTWRVSFNRKTGAKIKIDTIEDFILFVEAVEQQYPSAKPGDVVSEIRQLWYSDVNWELLVGSKGIEDGGAMVDIETEPNPVAVMFDMKDLAPASGGKRLATRMGEVDIGHVIAGIDSSLSGFPSSYPKSNLSAHGHDDSDAELKYETLSKASGGDSRDFTTWAGDLGQAYAEFLVSRYVKSETKPLADFVSDKAPDAELLGDIQGYVAKAVWKKVPASASPTGGGFKISNIMRDLYLVDKSSGGGGRSYKEYMEIVSGKTGPDLRTFVRGRSIAFARPWYAKKAVEHRGWWGSSGWTKKGILNEALADFDTTHASHEAAAGAADKIDTPVDHFMKMLADGVK